MRNIVQYKCQFCKKTVEGQFEICPHCGKDKDGNKVNKEESTNDITQ